MYYIIIATFSFLMTTTDHRYLYHRCQFLFTIYMFYVNAILLLRIQKNQKKKNKKKRKTNWNDEDFLFRKLAI